MAHIVCIYSLVILAAVDIISFWLSVLSLNKWEGGGGGGLFE